MLALGNPFIEEETSYTWVHFWLWNGFAIISMGSA